MIDGNSTTAERIQVIGQECARVPVYPAFGARRLALTAAVRVTHFGVVGSVAFAPAALTGRALQFRSPAVWLGVASLVETAGLPHIPTRFFAVPGALEAGSVAGRYHQEVAQTRIGAEGAGAD